MNNAPAWNYDAFRELVRGERLPAALIDLDRFDANASFYGEAASRQRKSVRVASKSLRVPALLNRVFERGQGAFRGVMCYSAAEAAFLAREGFDDLLLGYPTVQEADLTHVAEISRRNRSVTMMVDCPDHIERLAAQWRDLGMAQPLRICVDVDVSWRPLGQHFGAQRSPIRSIAELDRLLDAIGASSAVKLVGVMTYEAHLAGVPDANPFEPLQSGFMRIMKHFARGDVKRKRERIAACLAKRGTPLEFINGGGTGSFELAIGEARLTEVTVGSGLLQSHLFDYYANSGHGGEQAAAICFALPITRIPQPDRVTCHSGTYVASGPAGVDRFPMPCLPEGLIVDRREGFGEVQTPLVVPRGLRGKLGIGDPIFFRPTKAGELAEHFMEYLLVQGGRIVERVKTYRGYGQCF
jgi:D-serine deaminase-like pyridoxal phosphate-dependent protein